MNDFYEIPGFPKYYVNTSADIYSSKHKKVLKHSISKYGIHTVLLSHKGHQHRIPVAKILAMVFIKNPSYFVFVNYRDSNPDNLSIDNIYWSDKSFRRKRNEVQSKIVEHPLQNS